MHERQIISILQSRIWRLGDKKRDKYIFCLLYVAQKGLEQSWEWTPHEIKHPLMSSDNLVVTVISKSTDIQTRREYKTRYSLIYFIIFFKSRICRLNMVLRIRFRHGIRFAEMYSQHVILMLFFRSGSIFSFPLTLYPPVPAWWWGLNLKNCCCHFIHNFHYVKSCRLKTRCRGGSHKSHGSVCLWCLKRNLCVIHTPASTYTHTHTSERTPTVFSSLSDAVINKQFGVQTLQGK